MKALTLRLDDETYERLRREAFERRTTITALIRDAMTRQADASAAEPERLALDALFPGTRAALKALTINPQGER